MEDHIFFVNGEYLPAGEATIPATDLAVLRGLGVFESLRTYKGHPFRLPEHLERLRQSAAGLGLPVPWEDDFLSQIISSLIAMNDLPEASIRIVVTGGESTDFFHPTGKPGLILMALPLKPLAGLLYLRGAKVATVEQERFLPEAKSINYVGGVVAMQEAKAKDPAITEVLYIDGGGRITEGITSNVFAFLNGVLVTPGENILMGVTRQVVLEIAQGEYQIEIRDLKLPEIFQAEEFFLTGSVKEILPVREIDNQVVGSGGVGPQTTRLMDMFRKHVRG
jgi:branched-chain amino acid aminotransferase